MFNQAALSGVWRKCGFVALLVLVALGPMTPSGVAQTLYGSLVGNITDPSGAGCPGAKVRVVNSGTGFVREAPTDERGAYLFSDLQPGRYEVTVSSGAFAPFTQRDVQISTNAVVRVNVPLQLASASEKVTVMASVTALQTDRADVRSEITGKQFQDLPVSGGRNYQSLLKLVPGLQPAAATEFDRLESAGGPRFAGERHDEEHEQYTYRWREQYSCLAAAALCIHSSDRSDRNCERGHEQHGCGTGPRRRSRDQCNDQIRHERLAWRGV